MRRRIVYARFILQRHTEALSDELVPSVKDSGLEPADLVKYEITVFMEG